MWAFMVLLVPVLLPTLVIKTTYCTNDTDSDVFVRYDGHVEANLYTPDPIPAPSSVVSPAETTKATIPTNPPTVYRHPAPTKPSTIPIAFEEETEAVVFIPNEAPVVRVEDEEEKPGFKLHDLLMKKDINDVLEKQFRLETEAPNDIVFVSEKNQEILEVEPKKKKKHKKEEEVEEDTYPVLDCDNLLCNNTIKSVCGGKIVNKVWQYRMFMNDCYFRKVNCNFKYQYNRYREVPLHKCNKIAGHFDERPFSYKPRYREEPKEKISVSARRSFSSRRSMAMGMDGQFCSHPCPVSCPDDYEPQCAVSATGQRKVFMNHCKLDDNSCLFAVVWHKRPLSDCIGGTKADMRQNRFFIGWMQRVGIVDSKGRLVLE